MLLEISDIEPIKNFFDVIYDSASEIEMKLDHEKLTINLLNNGHVAFYNLEISKDFFITYDADIESVLIFVEDFYKILKSSSKDDMLTLESNENYLICKFENGNNRRVFELPLADDSNETPIPPSIDYTGKFDIPLNELKQSVNDLDKIVKTHKFNIHTQEYQMFVTAPTDSMTKYSQTIDVDSDEICNVIVDIKYVQDLLKLSKINKNVTLQLGNGIPLSWIIESSDELVKVSGLIAPIIEED